jgi:heat shock protein HslJ
VKRTIIAIATTLVVGSATVAITRPDGRTRAIFFEKGTATGADLGQADGNMTFKASRNAEFLASGGALAADRSSRLPLANTQWRLVEFQSMDDAQGTTRPSDPSLYTMRLNGDGTVTMRLNCNHATGTWSANPSSDPSNGQFSFGPLAVTQALCPPPSMDESIAKQCPYIRGYLLKDGRLYLSLMADGGIYAWEPDRAAGASAPDVPASPEDGGPRDWEVSGVTGALNLREQPSLTARVIATFAPGTILYNLGCQRAEGRAWCDVQPFGGGPRGYVAAEYLKPAISPDGNAAMGPDDSALRAGQGKFDATGHLPCARSAGQPMTQCEFGVARAGGGYATVVIKYPDGRTRAIYFRMGRPIGADTSEADGYKEFRAIREGDLSLVRVGDERYEIPDAVVLGG